ncbi:15448_t:CDS:2 [Acaulospora colombiana]|uniref:15448_t:CDS:1 n=1 Tax=Acaulospora colombiana TaxID=27376 RepID=A0ACA9NJK0_9GLOM|nr:15448_t:CDS:2 [Acaulospora colombiana]
MEKIVGSKEIEFYSGVEAVAWSTPVRGKSTACKSTGPGGLVCISSYAPPFLVWRNVPLHVVRLRSGQYKSENAWYEEMNLRQSSQARVAVVPGPGIETE